MKPLALLGGLINVPEYAYRFVLSQAKIEIMSIDIPYTDYNVNKKGGKKTIKDDRADRLNEESVRKMRERIARQQAEQSEQINLTEFINQH